jgi:transcriptional regulator with XRE-family HTH domain
VNNAATNEQWLLQRHRAELASKLKYLRIEAGISTRELANRTNISQAKISKLENAQVNPKPADIRRIAECLHLRPEIRDRIVQQSLRLRHELTSTTALSTPATTLVDMTSASEIIGGSREWQSVTNDIIPISYQTTRYTAWTYGTGHRFVSLDTWMNSKEEFKRGCRTHRQQRRDIVSESVLRRPLLELDAWLEQLHSVKERMGQPGLELGILPDHIQLPVSTWTTFDGHYTLSENAVDATGPLNAETSIVKRYVETAERLTDEAVWGGAAMRMIDDAIGYVKTIDLRQSARQVSF